jgi:hypothetical protein
MNRIRTAQELTQILAEPKLRPHLRCVVRRVQGQGNGAKRAEEGISSALFLLFRSVFIVCILNRFEPNWWIFPLFLEVEVDVCAY